VGGWIAVEAGSYQVGTDDADGFAADGEGPPREVTVDGFRIAATAVTTDEYAAFVAATGHVSEAERYGWSFVFGGLLPDDFPDTRGVQGAEWWRQVFGADWRHPEGPHSGLDDRGDHPVVHVAWTDAVAYSDWAGARLPTEAEWEIAARGGLRGARFAWGDEFAPDGRTMCNVFEGTFPGHNTAADGYVGTAPVTAFDPNGYGLHNVAGNVWEWCADWFDPQVHRQGPEHDPRGPDHGEARVMRGGSYLCHDSYCNRYRVGARSSNTPDSSTGNLGFRLAADR